MKKMLTICMFAATVYVHSQEITFMRNYEVKLTQEPEEPEGWIKVYNNNLIGYIDDNGMEVVTPVYEEIGEFNELQEGWATVVKDGLTGIIDIYGNIIVEPQYNYIENGDYYNEGWLLVNKKGLYGFIDSTGQEIVEPLYTEISMPIHRTLRPSIKIATE